MLSAQAAAPSAHRGDAARLGEIVTAFARFGFGLALDREIWARWLGGAPPPAATAAGTGEHGAVRLRLLLESLGASFVKLGQLLALHADELPPAYRDELSRLLDDTSPLPFDAIAGVLAVELGPEWREHFTAFAEAPLASASIGQVHRATLRDGREVAVKVQRPGAEALFERDFALLGRIIRLGRLHTLLDLERDQLRAILDDVMVFTRAELDYRREAEAGRRFAALPLPGVVVPEVIEELVTRRVLVTTFLPGVTLNEILAHREEPHWLAERGIDCHELARRILRSQLHQCLEHGFFQADPHPANVLVLPDGRLGYVDFGIVGELEERARRDVVDMVLFELMDDYEGIWPILLRYSRPSAATDVRRFKEEYRALSERFKASAGKSFGERSLGIFVEEQLRLYHRHRMQTASGWTTYLRCVVVYGTTLATLSERLDFVREALPIYWELKLGQVWSGLVGDRPWASPLVRQGHELMRGWRALVAVGERAAAGELVMLAEEHPRLERQRNLRLRAGIWTALAIAAGGAALAIWTLGHARAAAALAGATAVCVWRLGRVLRRLG